MTSNDTNTIRVGMWAHETRDIDNRLTVSFDGTVGELAWLKGARVVVEASPNFLVVKPVPAEAPCDGTIKLADHGGRFPNNWELNVSGGTANRLATLLGSWGKTAMSYISGSNMLLIELPKDRAKIIRRHRKDKVQFPEVVQEAAVKLEPVVEVPAKVDHSRILARSILSRHGNPDTLLADKDAIVAALAVLS